jgi:hypothetical protein
MNALPLGRRQMAVVTQPAVEQSLPFGGKRGRENVPATAISEPAEDHAITIPRTWGRRQSMPAPGMLQLQRLFVGGVSTPISRCFKGGFFLIGCRYRRFRSLLQKSGKAN